MFVEGTGVDVRGGARDSSGDGKWFWMWKGEQLLGEQLLISWGWCQSKVIGAGWQGRSGCLGGMIASIVRKARGS
jgi:hypothetical protein